jgi:hypothetical protein
MFGRITTGVNTSFHACLDKARSVANQVHLPATRGGKLALGATLVGLGALIARITDVRAAFKFFMEKALQRCSTLSMPVWVSVSRASLTRAGTIAVPTAAATATMVLGVQRWKRRALERAPVAPERAPVVDLEPTAPPVDHAVAPLAQVAQIVPPPVAEEESLQARSSTPEPTLEDLVAALSEEGVGAGAAELDSKEELTLAVTQAALASSEPPVAPAAEKPPVVAPPVNSKKGKHRREDSIQGVPEVDAGKRGCCSAKPVNLSNPPAIKEGK